MRLVNKVSVQAPHCHTEIYLEDESVTCPILCLVWDFMYVSG